MKKDIHPTYRKVLFVDSASGHRFVCGSTLQTEAKEKFKDVEYPVSYLSISSSSHPFFTGSTQLVDAEGRVEKFNKRFGRKQEIVKDESSQEDKQKNEAFQEDKQKNEASQKDKHKDKSFQENKQSKESVQSKKVPPKKAEKPVKKRP